MLVLEVNVMDFYWTGGLGPTDSAPRFCILCADWSVCVCPPPFFLILFLDSLMNFIANN